MNDSDTCVIELPMSAIRGRRQSLGVQGSSNDTFIQCRQRVLSYLVKLNRALDNRHEDLTGSLLNRFCEVLVDYLSAGHFRAFHTTEPDPFQYVAIADTTRQAMRFNDRFTDGFAQLGDVKGALEQLALALETRFELEDDMLSCHG